MRRRVQAGGSLTSLIDVLFILVFASLVHAGARAAAPTAEVPPVPAPPGPPPSFAALRRAAVAAATTQAQQAPLIVVHVAADGTATSLEEAGGARPLGLPLVERVADPDVALAYLGDRAPALTICGLAARELRRADLAGHVVAIAPAAALTELPVALVAGLRRDVGRCQLEQHAMAVILEPNTVEPDPPAPAPAAPAPAPVAPGSTTPVAPGSTTPAPIAPGSPAPVAPGSPPPAPIAPGSTAPAPAVVP